MFLRSYPKKDGLGREGGREGGKEEDRDGEGEDWRDGSVVKNTDCSLPEVLSSVPSNHMVAHNHL